MQNITQDRLKFDKQIGRKNVETDRQANKFVNKQKQISNTVFGFISLLFLFYFTTSHAQKNKPLSFLNKQTGSCLSYLIVGTDRLCPTTFLNVQNKKTYKSKMIILLYATLGSGSRYDPNVR